MDSKEKKWSMSFNPLHLKYWIFILILVIIAIVSYYYSGDNNLTGMIAFAATVASIILSVLAIFMTILSNNSIGGMLHKVRDLHDAVTPIPETLKGSISELKETTTGLRSINDEVKRSLSSLSTKLEDLDSHLKENDDKIEKLYGEISRSKPENESPEQPSANLVGQYLNTLSLNGLLLLYGFMLYKEMGKTEDFKLDVFTKHLFGAEPSYMHGILIASASANIIEFENVEDVNNLTIKNMSLSSHIRKDVLQERIAIICEDIRTRIDNSFDYYQYDVVERRVRDYVDSLK